MASATVGWGVFRTAPRTVVDTTDGGRTWRVAYRAPFLLVAVAAAGPRRAFALGFSCGASPCRSALFAAAGVDATWRTIWRSDALTAVAMSFPSAQDGFVAAEPDHPATPWAPGALLRTTDGGRTWVSLRLPACGGYPLDVALDFRTASQGWALCGGQGAVGEQGKALYRTGDAGVTWTRVAETRGEYGGPPRPSPIPLDGYVAFVVFRSAQVGWIGLERYGVLQTTDGGRTFHPVLLDLAPLGSDNVEAMGMTPSGLGWLLAGEGPPLYTTRSAGARWRLAYPPPRPTQVTLFAGGDAIGWAAPQVLGGTWAGARWSWLGGTPTPVGTLQALSPIDLVAANFPGPIEASRDAGVHWTTLATPPGWGALAFGLRSFRAGWVVMANQDIVHALFALRDSAGRKAWRRVATPFAPLLAASLTASTGFALGSAGAGGAVGLWRTGDGGRRWTRVPLPGMTPTGLGGRGRLVWVYGTDGVAVSADAGRTWTRIAWPGDVPLYDVSFGDPRHAMAVTGDGLWVTGDGGRTWRAVRTSPAN